LIETLATTSVLTIVCLKTDPTYLQNRERSHRPDPRAAVLDANLDRAGRCAPGSVQRVPLFETEILNPPVLSFCPFRSSIFN
jgi:hypothetical protein